MTYFHPRDFDAGQPMIQDLSYTRKFKSYYGLSSAMGKLEFLIKKYPFVDLATAEKEINWEEARVVRL
jgi:hypothetical protein